MEADWCAFCQAIFKGVEGSEWRELYHHYRDLSKAAGAKKKPSESQKAKALWAMKAAKDGWDDFYDLARMWEEHLKDIITAWGKALNSVENQYQG